MLKSPHRVQMVLLLLNSQRSKILVLRAMHVSKVHKTGLPFSEKTLQVMWYLDFRSILLSF